MRFFVVFLVAVAVMVAGCGGGGGGGGDPVTGFYVTAYDSGCGFKQAIQPNIALLGTETGYYKQEVVRAIAGGDIKSDIKADFTWALGTPKDLDSSGVGVFEVRVTQGVANVWHSGDSYVRWTVNGHIYVLGFGPPTSNYRGWTVWDATSVGYVGKLQGYRMTIATHLLPRSGASVSGVASADDNIREQMKKIREKYHVSSVPSAGN